MTTERYGVALLKNTRDAMVIEERAKKEGLAVRIIPTPSKRYARCGFSLKYDLSEEEALKKLLKKNSFPVTAFTMLRKKACPLHTMKYKIKRYTLLQ